MNKKIALNILNLNSKANYNTIKQRFKYLAKLHHPDKGGEIQKFIEINKAYKYLIKFQQIKLSIDLQNDLLDHFLKDK